MDDASPLQTHDSGGSDAGRADSPSDAALAAILAATTRAEARALYSQHRALFAGPDPRRLRIAHHIGALMRSEHAAKNAAERAARRAA